MSHGARPPDGVLVHRYGPHIFHTDDDRVWAYVSRFAANKAAPPGLRTFTYYPLHLIDDRLLLALYVEQARREAGVTFAGRLGTYSYLELGVNIGRALVTAAQGLVRLPGSRNGATKLHPLSAGILADGMLD